jgi:Ca2+/Na+ antiporter
MTSQVKKSKLLERSWIDIKQLEMSLNRINKVILPFRMRLAQNERRMFLYLLMGFAITMGLSAVFGFFVHYGLSIFLICLYFGGLIYIVRRYHRENDNLQRAIHFNTCLVVRNENERLYSRYNLRARVGFLS